MNVVYPNCTCVPNSAGNHSLTCPVSAWMGQISEKYPVEIKPLGWVCPVCNCGVAPTVERCPCNVVSIKFQAPTGSGSIGSQLLLENPD